MAEAKTMRERGIKLTEIADRFGVSVSTISRWTSPGGRDRDRESSRAWKRRNAERVREYAAHRYKMRKVECPECGELMGPGSERCQSCVSDDRERRRNAIERLWHEGLKIREIAEELDTTPQTVGVEIHHMRADGRDVPHRYRARS